MGTQYQIRNETKIIKNQKVKENDHDQLESKREHKSKKTKKWKTWKYSSFFVLFVKHNRIEFNTAYHCQILELFIINQKHQIDKKAFWQDKNFSSTLSYANEKIREIY